MLVDGIINYYLLLLLLVECPALLLNPGDLFFNQDLLLTNLFRLLLKTQPKVIIDEHSVI